MNRHIINIINGILVRIMIIEGIVLFVFRVYGRSLNQKELLVFFAGFLSIFALSVSNKNAIGMLDNIYRAAFENYDIDLKYVKRGFRLGFIRKGISRIARKGYNLFEYYSEPILMADVFVLGMMIARILL